LVQRISFHIFVPSSIKTTIERTSRKMQQQDLPMTTMCSGITPTINDVLCGQGKFCYGHQGNQNFRIIITLSLPKYLNHETTKKEKTLIIENVVEGLYEEGTSFLRKEYYGWVPLSKQEAKEKVGHAIRDARTRMRRSLLYQESLSNIELIRNDEPYFDADEPYFKEDESYLNPDEPSRSLLRLVLMNSINEALVVAREQCQKRR